MCAPAAADSSLTIRTNRPIDPSKTAGENYNNVSLTPPPPIDPTDKAVRAAASAERRKQSGGSRAASFLTGPSGDTTAPTTESYLGGSPAPVKPIKPIKF